MPVYNASLYLHDAIDSVLKQSYTNFELIIINDGSSDNSLDIIKSFHDNRIQLINNEKNLGIIATRNIGLKAAKGKYIANMDADDICLPTRFEKQVNYLEANPTISILATKLILINTKNEEIGYWTEDNHTTSENEIERTLPIINCIGQPTIMMRSADVINIGYNKHFLHNEDWGLWLHLLSLKKRIAKLPEVLLKYRQHPASTTVSANQLGVEKKIIAFKLNYLKNKLTTFNFKHTDKAVLSSLIKESIKYVLLKTTPIFYNRFIVLKNLHKLSLIKQFLLVRKQLQQIKKSPDVIYFFSSFHTGGADRVHASILEAANKKSSVSFITSKSDNQAFYTKFSENSSVIEVYELLKFGPTQRWLINKIKLMCNTSPNIKLLGCNSAFYYTIIPQLPKHAFIIDLVHAFVHQFEDGPEKWSLPVVEKIDKRIVINEKTKKDFENFYQVKNISKQLLERIIFIPNFVETQNNFITKSNSVFKVGYVGRGSEEKRVPLIAEVASNIKNKNIEFHFVGNVKPSIPEALWQYCIFHNEISNDNVLQELYKQFHVLVIASTREGFPMVIMEAMMQSAVPISTNVGGIAEHIHHNENGLLINTTNEIEIVNELETHILNLQNNHSEFERLSINAHLYALSHFNKNNFFKSYQNLLIN